MNDHTITAHELGKTFDNGHVAVNGLNLAVPRGTVYGLIGRNGAGKTTTLRMLLGLLRPTRGSAQILGMDVWRAKRADRQRVAYVSQEQQLPPQYCAAELCLHMAKLYDHWDHVLAGRIMKKFDLRVDEPLANLSGGDQRKVAVALAFASRPEVLILDEPAAGLDPIARRQLIEEMADYLSESAGHSTVLFSTHIIADLERVAEHIGIMDRGRLIAGGNMDELQSGMRRVQVIFDNGHVPSGFNIAGSMRFRNEGSVHTAVVRFRDSDDPLASLRSQPGLRVTEFPLGLEDLFIELLDKNTGHPATAPQ